jgi:hypothetical protein
MDQPPSYDSRSDMYLLPVKPGVSADCVRGPCSWLHYAQTSKVRTDLIRRSGKNQSPTFLCCDTDRIENDASNNSSLLVLVAAGKRLPRHCLATIWVYRDRHTDSPLLRHGPRRKQRVQGFFFVSSIGCRANVYTKLLPSNDRGTHIQTHRLMGGLYEIRHWDGLRCHHILTKFHYRAVA